jgi:hydrogenase nickel incorporation protein HypB
VQVQTLNGGTFEPRTAAQDNRRRFEQSGVFAVNLVGGPGCGKTSLIRRTVECIDAGRRVGVIVADPDSHVDGDALKGSACRVAEVRTAPCGCLDARDLRDALDHIDPDSLDLLLIENVSTLIGPAECDLGECKRVAVFSVAAGDDKLLKYPDVVRWADVVVLNKTDLLESFRFNLGRFRNEVTRVNPGAALFEMSTLTGEGVDPWLSWLRWESHRVPRNSPSFPMEIQ